MKKMKKIKEKDIRSFEAVCVMAALAVCVLCILFLFDLLQNHWFLNLILGLGVLLHVALFLLAYLKRNTTFAVLAAVLAVWFLGTLIYFNVG